ncbi:MAG: pyridoxal phosphate-dependent aminotransferase [Helicobacter sp.]|nr:pyridoxal phosphate-dependent aminotransferase [Helicobacter sp.]
MQYSHRIQTLEESVTIAVSSLARELKAKGRDILSFSAGEPDFDTPQSVKNVAIDAINAGFTKYTAVGGIPELKDAIIAKLKRENGLSYERSEVLVSNGAKHSLFNIGAALIDHDDEVLIPVPFWVTYPELVKYYGGKPVLLPTNDANAFKITPEQLRAALTPRTKMLILNSPSNPTGSVYSRDELAALGKVLEGTNVWVVSDEMYEKLLYEGEFCSTAFASEDLLQRTIVVNGVSKSAAMTGWRMGYCACKDKKLIKLMDNLQGQCTSNINSITQKAAIAALDGRIDSDIESMRKEFCKRRDIVVEGIAAIKGLSVVKPSGAFYVFVNISKIESDSVRFCKALLEKEGVAVVPGSGFGMDGYFRFSFATDLPSIMQGIERINRFVQSY